MFLLSPVCRSEASTREGGCLADGLLDPRLSFQVYDSEPRADSSQVEREGSRVEEKGNPGGCKMQGSYFNPAEVWSQEDWEIEPKKLS